MKFVKIFKPTIQYVALCCTGYLAVCCQPKLFEELIARLLNGLAQGKESPNNFSVNNTKTFIQAIGAIRWAGLYW